MVKSYLDKKYYANVIDFVDLIKEDIFIFNVATHVIDYQLFNWSRLLTNKVMCQGKWDFFIHNGHFKLI